MVPFYGYLGWIDPVLRIVDPVVWIFASRFVDRIPRFMERMSRFADTSSGKVLVINHLQSP